MAGLTLYLSVLITIANLNYVRSDNTTDALHTTTTTTTTTTTDSAPKNTTTTEIPLIYWSYDVHCKFQADSRDCSESEKYNERWYYDIKMEDCKLFKHLKCRSNNRNIFRSYQECREHCRDAGPHAIEHVLPENAACHMQPEFGDCQDYIQMFYFDVSNRRCQGFAFSGCGGNQNRFYDDKTCAAVCTDVVDNQYIHH